MEETLLDKGYLIIAPIGTSMLPLIRPNRDVTVLKKKTLQKDETILQCFFIFHCHLYG